MPKITICKYNDEIITIDNALEIREKEDSRLLDSSFICVCCGQSLRAHKEGGRRKAHFEHRLGSDCANSDFWDNSSIMMSLEGRLREVKKLTSMRNREIVDSYKKNKNYTCEACGYYLKIGHHHIIECHHTNPMSRGERISSWNELLCLCPNCHSIAHTTEPPQSLEAIVDLLTDQKA